MQNRRWTNQPPEYDQRKADLDDGIGMLVLLVIAFLVWIVRYFF